MGRELSIKPVLLDVVYLEEINDLLCGIWRKNIRKKAAVRLFKKAKARRVVLSGVDAATILRLSPSTKCHYIKSIRGKHQSLCPEGVHFMTWDLRLHTKGRYAEW